MTAATVLVPTHRHPTTLRLAVQSALAQTLDDFELFLVGDGVCEATREIAHDLASHDQRIRFFDFEKAPGQGELNRHRALQEARGRFVAYLGDDDCWMPGHLAVLQEGLAEADFCHTLQVGIDRQGQIVVLAADLQNPAFRERMLNDIFNRFDFSFAGHTLEAYERLPYGWRTTPPEFPWTDLYMWRQFLSVPWCRARSIMVPTGINTWSHQRPHLSDQERAADLAHWYRRIAEPEFREELWRRIADHFSAEAVAFDGELARLTASTRALQSTNAAMADELIRWRQQCAALEARRAELDAALEARRAELDAALEARRAELDAALEAKRAEFDAAMARAMAASAQAETLLRSTLDQTGAALREAEAARHGAEGERARVQATLAQLAGSKSWRYTRPLRAVWTFARRFTEPETRG